ncbi:MAG: bifunctional metallophosphatase/5'-nucleotidase [Chlorobi bacterium]|nr:bifunctional metallophosphatase/5'-nucleotidase [Chlorobiota bacterium]
MKYRIFSVLIQLLIAGSLFSQQVNIIMLETTDVHGSVFPYDFIKQTKISNSLAQVSTYVKAQRQDSAKRVFLFDNGDILQGQPVAYYYNFEDTNSIHIFPKVMNYMKYDAATIGNHDIETGHAVYDRVRKEFNFEWLAANGINTETNLPYWTPYKIFIYKEIKIAVLGLTTPGIPMWLPQNLWSGIEFEDMIKSAKKWVSIIKENEKPDLIIGLFHSGIDFTYGGQTAETPKNENATMLIAKQVPGFDVIFCGHDHVKYNSIVTNVNGNKVLILNAGSHAKYIAEADIQLVKDPKNSTWNKKLNGKLIDVAKIEIDNAFMLKFQKEYTEVKNYVSEPIVNFKNSIDLKDAYFGSSAFIDLIHRVQLYYTKADISFAAPLSYSAKIDSGEVLVSDMFKLYKYENMLYTMKLTGQEIKNYLEYSYSHWLNTMTDENDYLLNYKYDSSGNPVKLKFPYYDFDSANGIKYTVNASKPDGNKINIISMQNGEKFDTSKMYNVALNSYRGNGGGGHLTKGAGLTSQQLTSRLINSTDIDMRFLMMHWLKEQKEIAPKATNNWKIIPEKWVANRRIIETEMFFDE